MGGYVFLLRGQLEGHLIPSPRKPSLMQRLLGRSSDGWRPMGDILYRDLPGEAFQPFYDAFNEWVHERLGEPWPASRVVLDYLDGPYTEISVRGIRGAQQPETDAEWYLQLLFSGCAGQAEVSSRVAAHWAKQWYAAEGQEVAESFLKPNGFIVEGVAPDFADEQLAFYPLGECGYALYQENPSPWFDDDGKEYELHFEVDDAALETCSDVSDALRRLETDHAGKMADGSCHCQLCEQ